VITMSQVADTPENVERCTCAECPSFPGVGILYCARGRSEQPVRERGCICPDCKNFKEFGLQDDYYCVEGSAK
jgi:aldose sugar dehydrogenase